MESAVKSLASRKQLLAAIVAAGLLVGIFVPFQNAFALDVDFDDFPEELPKSGIPQEITFDIVLDPGEVLPSGTSVEIQISPGTANPGDAEGTIVISGTTGTFTATSPGTPPNLLTDITLSPGSDPISGYAYAYSYGVTNGWVGPLTITVTAKLHTAPLAPGNAPVTHDVTVTIDGDEFETELTIVPGNVNVHVRSKLAGPGGFFTGMDMHIKSIECDIDANPSDPECADIVTGSSIGDFTPITFTQNHGLIQDTEYFLYATEFAGLEFVEWQAPGGGVLTPTVDPNNERGINFVAGPGLQFIAVYTTDPSVDSETFTPGADQETQLNLGGGKKVKVKFNNVLEDSTEPGAGGILTAITKNPNILIGTEVEEISNGIPIVDVNGNDLGVIGDIIDIEFTGGFNGAEITLDYDPDIIDNFDSDSGEDDIVALHFNGASWVICGDNPNVGANTIVCEADSLSLFTVAVQHEEAATTSGGGGGGGGGGRGPVVVSWPAAQTQPESHFALFPLDKIRVASSAFINAAGISIAEGRINQQISVSGEFTNYQEVSQNYAFIVQVTDENGFVTDISWQESIIGSGSTSAISVLWTPETDGVYTVKIFVWDGISDTPQPLSSVTVKRINISE